MSIIVFEPTLQALTPSGSDTNGKPSTSMGSSSEKLEVSAPTNNQGGEYRSRI